MEVRSSLARAMLLIAGALGGCAAATGEDGVSDDEAIPEEPLEISVDALDVVHGTLRVSATMVDGAADVSIRLGGDCEHREIGGGLSTPTTLIWSFRDGDVADAIGCGLTVRTRVRERGHAVDKVAELAVGVDVSAAEAANPDDGPQAQSVAVLPSGVSVGFGQVRPGTPLRTGESILDADRGADDDAAPNDGTAEFVVPRLDFARSFLEDRELRIDGASFITSLSIGGTSIVVDAPDPCDPCEGSDETVEREGS
jgi:hypothetical protein